MRTVLQGIRDGEARVVDAPAPGNLPGRLLVRTTHTLISAGTERMMLDFGKSSWLSRARQQPDKVAQVLLKARTDGVIQAIDAVRAKLDQPFAPGYCHVGQVLAVGAGVSGFRVGDRVASNGQHAEVVSVPATLCARLPDGVAETDAAFTVLGAVALQAIRLAEPTLGEAVAVIGLGLVGLLTVQLLRAQGCRVLGLDFAPERLALAERFGAETFDLAQGDPQDTALAFSRRRGLDAVIVATATQSQVPVGQAARMARRRGRVVLVGTAGLALSRQLFFEKELSFQVSCSYGPGRYDPAYEQRGRDYPVAHVRWTAARNFEAVLDMMAEGRLDLASLVSHRFALEEAEKAYAVLDGREPSLGILLEADASLTAPALLRREIAAEAPRPVRPGAIRLGVIGAGDHARRTLIPTFRRAGAELACIATRGAAAAAHAGRRFGFARSSTDPALLIGDPSVEAVVIATRHDSHAALTIAALDAGRHVFVEKPLALSHAELGEVEAAWRRSRDLAVPPVLAIGFNRRFAPHVIVARRLLAARPEPKAFVMTVNAGRLASAHWLNDPEQGGGRILGEACHFIDLLRHLAGHPIARADISALGRGEETATVTLSFADGSIGTIHYLANGSRAFPKERLEIFCGGGVLVLENFRRLRAFGWPSAKPSRLWRQDKGQRACAGAFLQAIRGEAAPTSFAEIAEVSKVAIDLAAALRA
ncbi:MAG: bi-domain-containing oxidoreductase [Methylobacterium mesophilicum]|nr:bi-domain-containing oxidoreductase [Methylobacterium mesophilicum]